MGRSESRNFVNWKEMPGRVNPKRLFVGISESALLEAAIETDVLEACR
jgi:hypothetical protein